MRFALAALGLAVVFATHAPAAERIAVRVIDPSGESPLAGGGVACADPAGPGATVGADGRIPVLGSCKKVRCWAEGFLPGEAAVSGSSVDCRVTAAARIDGPLLGASSALGMEGRLYAAGTAVLAAREPLVPPAKPGDSPRVVLGPVAAGRYRLDVVRVSDGWTCRADLGPLAHGAHAISAVWRTPAVVRGKVVDGEGKPVESILVRAWNEFPEMEPTSSRSRPRVEPIGSWTCGPSAPLKKGTGSDGTFSFPADPEGPVLLAAGGWDDPLGVDARSFPKPPTAELVLRPQRPVRLTARVVDEEDRPVACRAALTVRSGESAWLAKLLPGAALEGPCSAEGAIRLGPFLSSDWELFVRPKPGLPLRLRGGAPAVGATEDLGTLVVRRGVSATVDVFDKEGAPLDGARVLGSGSAGLVFNVEAFTDETGRAEVSGFPEGARLRVEVSAGGFRTVVRDGIEIPPTPLRFELERAAVLEGEVVGESGEPVPGAEVVALAESGNLGARATSTPEGTFRMPDAPAGTLRLIASAQGYRRGDPVEIEVRAGDIRSGIVVELDRAKGLRGRVVDPAGHPVAGARVALTLDYGNHSADPSSAIATAIAGADGRFVLAADPQPHHSVIATATGYGPAVESSPLAKADSEIVLTLAAAGSVEVRLPADLPPSRVVSVTDGRMVTRTASAAGRTSLFFADLAVGTGEAALPPGARKPVEVVEGTTTVVDLREGPTVEGTVTKDGVPLPNFVVVMVTLGDTFSIAGSVEADASGRWRFENMTPGSYRFSAIGPEGRAEKRVDLPREGKVRVDLEVSSVIVDGLVRDAETGEPVAGASLFLKPQGAECSASMSTRSFGDLFGTDIDISVSDGGCGFGSTYADGRTRITLGAPGRFLAQIRAKRYERLEREVDLGPGVNALSLELTPSGGPKVRVTMRSDPPGLPGTLDCVRGDGHGRHSYGGISGTAECQNLEPGPAEVIFRIDGYGIGRTEFVVPEEGDIDVMVTAVRCGQLLVGRPPGSKGNPIVRDGVGVDWGAVLTRTGGSALQAIETAETGAAWLLRYVPPGAYAVELDGRPKGTVLVEAGATATLP